MNWNKVEIDVCKPRRGDIMRNRMQAKRSLRQQQAVERSPEGATLSAANYNLAHCGALFFFEGNRKFRCASHTVKHNVATARLEKRSQMDFGLHVEKEAQSESPSFGGRGGLRAFGSIVRGVGQGLRTSGYVVREGRARAPNFRICCPRGSDKES